MEFIFTVRCIVQHESLVDRSQSQYIDTKYAFKNIFFLSILIHINYNV